MQVSFNYVLPLSIPSDHEETTLRTTKTFPKTPGP